VRRQFVCHAHHTCALVQAKVERCTGVVVAHAWRHELRSFLVHHYTSFNPSNAVVLLGWHAVACAKIGRK
jgi:hypothetical protein